MKNKIFLILALLFIFSFARANQGNKELFQNASYKFEQNYMNLNYFVDPNIDSIYISAAFTGVHLTGFLGNYFENRPSGNYLFLAHKGKLELVYYLSTEPMDTVYYDFVNWFRWVPEMGLYEFVTTNPHAFGSWGNVTFLDTLFRPVREIGTPDPHDANVRLVPNGNNVDTMMLTQWSPGLLTEVFARIINNGNDQLFAVGVTPLSDTAQTYFYDCYHNGDNQSLGDRDLIHSNSAETFWLSSDTLVLVTTERHTHTMKFLLCTYNDSTKLWTNRNQNRLVLASFDDLSNEFTILNRSNFFLDGLHDARFYYYDGKEAFFTIFNNRTCSGTPAQGILLAVNLRAKTVRVLRDSAYGPLSGAMGSCSLISRTSAPLNTEDALMHADMLTCYGSCLTDTVGAWKQLPIALSQPVDTTIWFSVPPGLKDGSDGDAQIELRDSTGKLLVGISAVTLPDSAAFRAGAKLDLAYPYRAYAAYAWDYPRINRPIINCFKAGNSQIMVDVDSLSPLKLQMFSTGDTATIPADPISKILARASDSMMRGELFSSPYNASSDCLESGILPVEMMTFTCDSSGSISWKTASESNVDHFEVQNSLDALTWKTIGYVLPTGGNIPTEYRFMDTSFCENCFKYYRIKTVDRNGKFSISDICMERVGILIGQFSLFPNPVNPLQVIHFNRTITGQLIDVLGRVISIIDHQDHSVAPNVPGIYFLKASGAENLKILVQ